MYSLKQKLHLRQKAAKAGSLRSISFDVTTKCNMACPHCYAAPFMGERGVGNEAGELPISDFESFFHEAYDLGASHYILQGGEPIVDKDRLEKIISSLPVEETFINVVSNGWEMTDDNILWLKNLGVDKICFSLDSGIKQDHDLNRRSGAFDRVLAAIDSVVKQGLSTSISTVITHENIHSEGFRHVLDYAVSKKLRVDAQIAIPIGKWENRPDVLITKEDAAYIMQKRMELGLLPSGQYHINRDIYNFGGGTHCPAVMEFMAVAANGTIMPCNFCQFSLGNVKDKNLAAIRQKYMQLDCFSGKSQVCLVGEDRDFIKKYLQPHWGVPKPMDANKIFLSEVYENE